MQIYKVLELPVGVNECDHIRKLLNKNHMGKVPNKAAKCWKNERTLYYDLFSNKYVNCEIFQLAPVSVGIEVTILVCWMKK